MKEKNKKIIIKELGIDSEIIEQENSIEKLKTYRDSLFKIIVEINHKLDLYKTAYIIDNKSGNYKWYISAKAKKRYCVSLLSTIDTKVRNIKAQQEKQLDENYAELHFKVPIQYREDFLKFALLKIQQYNQ